MTNNRDILNAAQSSGTPPRAARVDLTADKIISPKVTATAITGAAITLGGAIILGAIDNLEPELFAALGGWGYVVYGGIISGGAVIAGWLKADPLRN